MQPSGLVTYADIFQAILIVKVICPDDPTLPRARLCKSILGEHRELVDELRDVFRRLRAIS
jgi:hypothetical protein